MLRAVHRLSIIMSVVDEQNRHTQVQRMSSSSSIKRENSEELKDAEPRKFDHSRDRRHAKVLLVHALAN